MPGRAMCRLCLCTGCRFVDAFEGKCNLGFNVKNVIEDLLQLDVVKEARHPWKVCSACLSKLTEFKLFKRRCLECQAVYENRVKAGEYDQDEDVTEREEMPVEFRFLSGNQSSTPCIEEEYSVAEDCLSDTGSVEAETPTPIVRRGHPSSSLDNHPTVTVDEEHADLMTVDECPSIKCEDPLADVEVSINEEQQDEDDLDTGGEVSTERNAQKSQRELASRSRECLDTAREKRRVADVASDVSSELETGNGKRRRKRVSRGSDGEDEALLEELSRPNKKATMFPPPQFTLLSPMPSMLEEQTFSTSVGWKSDQFTPKVQSTPGLGYQNKIGLDEEILRNVMFIKRAVLSMDERLKNIEDTGGVMKGGSIFSTASEPSYAINYDVMKALPLGTLESLYDMEDKLMDEGFKSGMVRELSRIGGNSAKDLVIRILKATLHDSVAAEFSWLGKKHKRAFVQLQLKEVIMDTVSAARDSGRKSADGTESDQDQFLAQRRGKRKRKLKVLKYPNEPSSSESEVEELSVRPPPSKATTFKSPAKRSAPVEVRTLNQWKSKDSNVGKVIMAPLMKVMTYGPQGKAVNIIQQVQSPPLNRVADGTTNRVIGNSSVMHSGRKAAPGSQSGKEDDLQVIHAAVTAPAFKSAPKRSAPIEVRPLNQWKSIDGNVGKVIMTPLMKVTYGPQGNAVNILRKVPRPPFAVPVSNRVIGNSSVMHPGEKAAPGCRSGKEEDFKDSMQSMERRISQNVSSLSQKVHRLEEVLASLSSKLDALPVSSNTEDEFIGMEDLHNLPIREVEDLYAFQYEIASCPNYRKFMLKSLKDRSAGLVFKGLTPKEITSTINKTIYGCLAILMTNEVARNFCMKGKSQHKISFEIEFPKVIVLIFDVVKGKNLKGPEIDLLTVKRSIGEWFRLARLRMSGGRTVRANEDVTFSLL